MKVYANIYLWSIPTSILVHILSFGDSSCTLSFIPKKYKMTNMRVAIIGAGPAGVAAAKSLALEPNAETLFSNIDVYERRDKAGGLWYYTAEKSHLTPPVPSVDVNAEEQGDRTKFVSPMYEHLETNIIKDIMQYKDFPFPESCEMFPTRSEVADYIHSYIKTIPETVKFIFNANVTSLEKVENEWVIKYNDSVAKYDYVILAQGHFDLPYIPDVEGLDNWNKSKPGSITHAKYFVSAADYVDQTVLVVGNSASGIDISTQLSTVAKKVVVSANSPSALADIDIEGVEKIGPVAKYDYENNCTITTSDGEVISGFDSVIFCTGYLYKIPFLDSYNTGEKAVITDGNSIRYLYKQMFYIPDPTMIHIGLPKNVIPMPFSECQAQYISRVITGRIELPSEAEMLKIYAEEVAEKGEGKSFHDLKYPKDVQYCNELCDSCTASEELSKGFTAAYWDEKRSEIRAKTGSLKAARLVDIVDHALKLKAEKTPFYLLRGEVKK